MTIERPRRVRAKAQNPMDFGNLRKSAYDRSTYRAHSLVRSGRVQDMGQVNLLRSRRSAIEVLGPIDNLSKDYFEFHLFSVEGLEHFVHAAI